MGDVAVLGEVLRYGVGERQLRVAREGEHAEERAGARVGLVLEEELVARFYRLLEERLGLVGVEDGEILRELDGLAVHAQGAVAEGVEGAAPEARGLDAGEVVHPVEHFLGGLVGEGEKEDLARLDALGQEVGDAVGQRARLARAGAGEHQQRAGRGRDRGELLVVEQGLEVDGRDGGGTAGKVTGENEIH